jgi:hypothetical protein
MVLNKSKYNKQKIIIIIEITIIISLIKILLILLNQIILINNLNNLKILKILSPLKVNPNPSKLFIILLLSPLLFYYSSHHLIFIFYPINQISSILLIIHSPLIINYIKILHNQYTMTENINFKFLN